MEFNERNEMEREGAGTRMYWVGATGGQKVHRFEHCSITRRTRYTHFHMELTPEQFARALKCEKCFGPQDTA